MEFTSFSVRVWKKQLEIIEKATKAFSAKVGEELSVAEYVRRKLMPLAFADAGVQPEEFPPFVRGRQTAATQVAQKLGMPRRQLERAWIDRMASIALKELNEEEEPPSERSKQAKHSDVSGLKGTPQVIVRRRQQK